MEQLPTRKQVVQTLFERWNPERQTEIVPVDSALGRVLAKDYEAVYSIPVVRASAMDGVAVTAELFERGEKTDTSGWRLGKEFCRADTGDDFDDRFNAVIPIEKVEISEEGRLTIAPGVQVTPGMNIRPCGSTIKRGEPVGRKGRKLRPFDLACLAMGGITEAVVYKKPKIAFLPTGSELVPLGAEVRRGNNIDSNSVLAKNMLLEMGAEPLLYPITRDSREELSRVLEQAVSDADAVIISGGSSKGEEDFNARILEERGAALFHWVAAAPGKPMCVAVIDNKPVVNIPGPPTAMFYGMDWCARAIVNRLLDIPMPKRQTIRGELTAEISASPAMEILCMMDVERTENGYKVKQKPWKGGSMANTLGAGAFYITELGVQTKYPGETLEVTILRGEEEF